MKISYNWLREYIDLPESPDIIADQLTDCGLEVESLEKVEPVEGGLEGLVLGEVKECWSHPNADKLRITKVDTGEGELKQIVCGAPNVAVGQKVIVAPVGSTLYPADHDPIFIKKAKIRGEASEGMICAEDEIGMGTDHSGIMVLDTDLPVGTSAREVFNLSSDYLLEIGLTPNRADAASHIGVARDLKALLGKDVNWPSIESYKKGADGKAISVAVENHEACPRYSGVTISGVKVEDSPDWLKNRLLTIGLTPINNIVDITNFVLHELGQPLHAFDADKIAGAKVIVKTMPAGSKFTTLDEEERELQAEDLMICNEVEGMCIAGVFGGIKSGITEESTNIFLESAYFSPDYIRKTAQYHQLKTDASFRYERGTDPNITVYALKRAALLIQEIAGGKISSDIIDIYPSPIQDREVNVKFKNIHRLIGKALDKEEILSILNNLEIKTTDVTEGSFTAIVPPYRVDVTREADIIEEILRIYGFNNVELPEHASTTYIADFPINSPDKIQREVTDLLVDNGFYEIITNSLTKPVYAEKLESINANEQVEIINKLSEDLGVMRQSLLFNGLEVIAHNINRQRKNLRFFEFGKTYFKKEGKYEEKYRLACWLTGKSGEEHWQTISPYTFYDLAGSVYKVLDKLVRLEITKEQIAKDPFEYALELKTGNYTIGLLGKVKPAYLKLLNIKQETFYADLDWDLLLSLTNDNIVVEDVPRFPEVRRDLSLVVDKKTSFESLRSLAERTAGKLLKRVFAFDVYEGEKVEKDKKAYALGFILQDPEKTLTDKQIDKTMNRLMQAYEQESGALIRQ
ncbi:MAG: phenylalanine--tRNA ligase subunit beta [Candidatus Cyclobacteriaceae bacterium M2_1C_046]